MRKGKKKPGKFSWKAFFIVLAVIFIYGYIFRDELQALIKVIQDFYQFILGAPVSSQFLNVDLLKAIFIIVSGLFIYFTGKYLISPFLMPTLDGKARKLGYRYFGWFLKRQHGPSLQLVAGKNLDTLKPVLLYQPTVAFIDLSSALVLEKPMYTNMPINTGEVGVGSPGLLIRVCKPGVNFLEAGEKIYGAADLRPQIRFKQGFKALTRDRIELETSVYVVFTLGQLADEILLTFADNNSQDLRIIHLSEQWFSDEFSGRRIKVVTDLKDSSEIDEDDRFDAMNYFTRYKSVQPSSMDRLSAVSQEELDIPSSPYICDLDRVASAVYSTAFSAGGEKSDHWTELPTQVASEIFRSFLQRVSYDDLYLPEQTERFPLKTFKHQFNQEMRNQGVLSYRFVERKDGNPIEIGQRWDDQDLIVSPPQQFRHSKILRDRGIKIINAGFTELKPNALVRQQILDFWKTRWDKEFEITKAKSELEAMRIKNRARVEAQEKMTSTLTEIFNDENPHKKEALAFHLLHELETAATDPATKKLLPRETLNILWELRQWLLPEQKAEKRATESPTTATSGDGV
jgi:hypothetical protein